MPGLPVHQQLQEFTQTQLHWVGDAIQPSHLLLSASPPAFNLSQNQGLYKWVSSSHQVAKVLEFQLQYQWAWESFGLQGDPTSQSWRKSVLNIHWKDWCWSWNSNTLATWCKEPAHWKRPWCWDRFRAGGEGDDRGWDGWMASSTQWTWVWTNSGR